VRRMSEPSDHEATGTSATGTSATGNTDWQPDLHRVSTVVYAERAGKILLLKRAVGFLSGQWFLPGGALDAGESPVDGARRELKEEAGLDVEGDLELVGVYWSAADAGYGQVFISYRGRATDGDVRISHEHDGARWVDPHEMRGTITDEFIDALAQGDARLGGLIQSIRDDLDEYLARRPRP
jgi:8-oxo-dGTP diphosphatase